MIIGNIKVLENMNITYYKARLTHSKVSYVLPAPRCNLQTTNIPAPDDGGNSNKRYHIISQVAYKQVQPPSYMYVSGADSSNKCRKIVSCFLYSKKVAWKISCPMIDNDVAGIKQKKFPGSSPYEKSSKKVL